MISDKTSIVHYLSEEKPDRCGYCKTKKGSARHGLWAIQLTVEDYQALIDRGWRRCGHYCYKPLIKSACCSMYTIRCSALNFIPTKSQKRILKRFNGFITSDIKKHCVDKLGSEESHFAYPPFNSEVLSAELKKVIDIQDRKPGHCNKTVNNIKQLGTPNFESKEPKLTVSNQKETKKKQIRINRKRDKLRSQGFSEEEVMKKMLEKKRFPVNKNVEDFMNECSRVSPVHQFEVKLVRTTPVSPEFLDTFEQSYSLYKRYQVSIHKDRPETITRKSFERFLVDSPLIEDSQFGSFHQQYWIDGKLIAVGVIDILPKCVSSVYLFYDPEYAFLGLGTYSALRELFFVRSLAKTHTDLTYYYMGFYIQSCPKMRYKGAFQPSFLLCPEAYTWHPIENCVKKIEAKPSTRFNENPEAEDEESKSIDIDNIPVIYNRRIELVGAIPPGVLPATTLREYCSLVGASCSKRMLLQL